MTPLARFLFDENTGAPFVEALRGVARLDRKRPTDIGHTISLFGAGAKDQDWVPKVVQDDWIVISEDRGINSRAGDKLPVLCVQHRVTHVLVLPALLKNGGQFEKMRAIIAVWPQLLELSTGTKGARYTLQYTGATRTGFRLEARASKVPSAPAAPPKKPLGKPIQTVITGPGFTQPPAGDGSPKLADPDESQKTESTPGANEKV